MIDLLRAHQQTLTEVLQQAREMQPDKAGLRITMNIYKMILEDGIKTLAALIAFLSNE